LPSPALVRVSAPQWQFPQALKKRELQEDSVRLFSKSCGAQEGPSSSQLPLVDHFIKFNSFGLGIAPLSFTEGLAPCLSVWGWQES
jgi:hypothetical protein